MNNKKLAPTLERLGFTQDWIDYGIISEEFVFKLFDEILNSEDQNAEHYRSGAFGKYIKSKDSLTNEEIRKIFKLQDDGPDKCDLHANRIICLIQSGLLTKQQLDSLTEYPEVLELPIAKLYKRTKLLEDIKTFGIEANFEKVKKTTDTAVHEFILNLKDLERHHVEWAATLGGNKRTRNIAKQMLNSKHFR